MIRLNHNRRNHRPILVQHLVGQIQDLIFQSFAETVHHHQEIEIRIRFRFAPRPGTVEDHLLDSIPQLLPEPLGKLAGDIRRSKVMVGIKLIHN